MTSCHGKKHFYMRGPSLLDVFIRPFLQWISMGIVPRPLPYIILYIPAAAVLFNRVRAVYTTRSHGTLSRLFFFNAKTERISIIIFKFNLERARKASNRRRAFCVVPFTHRPTDRRTCTSQYTKLIKIPLYYTTHILYCV